MTSGRPELVSARTRRAVREMMSGTVLRDIDGMWQDEGFAPSFEEDPAVGGQRVSRFQSYLDQVDWTDRAHVDRALRVFETALVDIDEQYLAGVRRHLERDGYSFVDGRIAGGPVTAGVRERSLSAVENPAAIREHLDRISRALADDDPRQAIGSAKELIESTAKLVLRSRGLAVNDRDDFPELVRAAQMTLEVHPKQATPSPDGSDAVKRILGAATAAALGVNDLRNRGFGTGHGSTVRPAGLGPRHAHLAVSAAKLWCEFMLDTLADPAAPWRKHADREPAS